MTIYITNYKSNRTTLRLSTKLKRKPSPHCVILVLLIPRQMCLRHIPERLGNYLRRTLYYRYICFELNKTGNAWLYLDFELY